eukprot:2897899-Pyramimonas_sp.AAC.1
MRARCVAPPGSPWAGQHTRTRSGFQTKQARCTWARAAFIEPSRPPLVVASLSALLILALLLVIRLVPPTRYLAGRVAAENNAIAFRTAA